MLNYLFRHLLVCILFQFPLVLAFLFVVIGSPSVDFRFFKGVANQSHQE